MLLFIIEIYPIKIYPFKSKNALIIAAFIFVYCNELLVFYFILGFLCRLGLALFGEELWRALINVLAVSVFCWLLVLQNLGIFDSGLLPQIIFLINFAYQSHYWTSEEWELNSIATLFFLLFLKYIGLI